MSPPPFAAPPPFRFSKTPAAPPRTATAAARTSARPLRAPLPCERRTLRQPSARYCLQVIDVAIADSSRVISASRQPRCFRPPIPIRDLRVLHIARASARRRRRRRNRLIVAPYARMNSSRSSRRSGTRTRPASPLARTPSPSAARTRLVRSADCHRREFAHAHPDDQSSIMCAARAATSSGFVRLPPVVERGVVFVRRSCKVPSS